jgi:hypothetical protein
MHAYAETPYPSLVAGRSPSPAVPRGPAAGCDRDENLPAEQLLPLMYTQLKRMACVSTEQLPAGQLQQALDCCSIGTASTTH